MKSATVRFPYTPQYTMQAIKDMSLSMPPGMKIKYIDEVGYKADINAGVSGFSWGEKVQISVFTAEDGRGTIMEIQSSPKLITNVLDGGKNQRNIDAVIFAVQSQLAKYPTI